MSFSVHIFALFDEVVGEGMEHFIMQNEHALSNRSTEREREKSPGNRAGISFSLCPCALLAGEEGTDHRYLETRENLRKILFR